MVPSFDSRERAAKTIQYAFFSWYIRNTVYFKCMLLVNPIRYRYISKRPFGRDLENERDKSLYSEKEWYFEKPDNLATPFQDLLFSDYGRIFVYYLTDVQKKIIFDRYIQKHTKGNIEEYDYIMNTRGLSCALIEKILLIDNLRLPYIPRQIIKTDFISRCSAAARKIQILFFVYKYISKKKLKSTDLYYKSKRCRDCYSFFYPLKLGDERYPKEFVIKGVTEIRENIKTRLIKINGIWGVFNNAINRYKGLPLDSDIIFNIDIARLCRCRLVDDEDHEYGDAKYVCLGGCKFLFTCGHVNNIYKRFSHIKDYRSELYTLDCNICGKGISRVSWKPDRISTKKLIGYHDLYFGHSDTSRSEYTFKDNVGVKIWSIDRCSVKYDSEDMKMLQEYDL